ncbi:DUF397 domain-containing protein [Streptomyces montanisoli]|uniref:DUF397 domain-containing protein n=1 Tax=Streptomyces montanisoli TaxID=2798581 RepID=A0A940M8J7_9ACTN|nr:DUF397 domain-containing protein [Streptomyces montanisoli]MBP0458234.1 DUF397 domain-containing protein [Streptomyces montanisoli]
MNRERDALETPGTRWFKSSYSGSNDNDCVEVAAATHAVLVRDSKNATGPRLTFAASAWVEFVGHAAGRER